MGCIGVGEAELRFMQFGSGDIISLTFSDRILLKLREIPAIGDPDNRFKDLGGTGLLQGWRMSRKQLL